MRKTGLGKGLSALLGESMGGEAAGAPREVSLDLIQPNPFQPRLTFDPTALEELAQSIREHGVLQPVLLRRRAADSFEIIAGERRVRAAGLAGLARVPALVRECSDREMLECALIENVQRADIGAVETALAYRRLSVEFGLSQEEIATRVGRSRVAVANTLRVLLLPSPILESLQRTEITEGHARSILQAPEERQVELWELIRRRGLSVRESERAARAMATRPPAAARPAARTIPVRSERDPNHVAVEEALQLALGTMVRIRLLETGARLEIDFYSTEELNGIVDRIIGPTE